MKIFGYEIGKTQVVEKFKGYFATGKGRPDRKTFYPGEHSWRDRCVHFNQLVEKHRLAQQAMLTLGGQLMAEGLFLQPATRKIAGNDQPYPRAEEALQACEELNERVHMESLLYDTGVSMGKYGSNFWEKTWSPRFDVRMIPLQELIEPESQDVNGDIRRWRYGKTWIAGLLGSSFVPADTSWGAEEIVPFHWNVTTFSWPYGTSILTGSEVQFDTLDDIKNNANAFMEGQAYPYEMYQVGNGEYQPSETEVAAIRSKWKNRRVGENLVTSYPIEIKQGGAGGSPIRELSQIMDFMKDDIIDGCMIPPISKLYNSTEASAKVLVAWAASNLVKPMQRIIAETLVAHVYKPYLMDLGYSVKCCPRVLFEAPDAHKVEDGEFWERMVTAKIATPQQAAEQLGLEYDEEYWKRQEEKEQFQQSQDKFNQNNQNQPQGEQKSEEVWEVRRKEVK